MGGTWYPDNYFAYIRSRQWATVVRRYFDKHPRRCSGCPAKVGIELHHRTYIRLEAEHESDLVPLCSACHSMVHGIHQMAGADLDVVTDLWIRAGRRAGGVSERRRGALTAARQKSRQSETTSTPVRDVVHVGSFSYVSKQDTSFVVWSTFDRKPKAVWRGTSSDQALRLSESIDRRALGRLAEAAVRPPKRSSELTHEERRGLVGPRTLNVSQASRPRAPQGPSIKQQLADRFERRRVRGAESFGYLKNIPPKTKYGEDT